MDMSQGRDRRWLVFLFMVVPLFVVTIAGLIVPDWFDYVLLAEFPGVVLILCVLWKLPWCFAGVMGKIVFYFWLAVTSMQWVAYGVAVVLAMRRGRLGRWIVLLAVVHLAAVCLVAYVMYRLCGSLSGEGMPAELLL